MKKSIVIGLMVLGFLGAISSLAMAESKDKAMDCAKDKCPTCCCCR